MLGCHTPNVVFGGLIAVQHWSQKGLADASPAEFRKQDLRGYQESLGRLK